MAERFYTHAEPVWRERADFIIRAPLMEAERFEQLWARKIDDSHFEVCCIPFFLYDIALGDIVKTATQGERQYVVCEVTTSSGRYVFRAFFEREQYRHRDGVVEALEALGAQVEWWSASLLAVDIEQLSARSVADLLYGLEQQGCLVYETGRSA